MVDWFIISYYIIINIWRDLYYQQSHCCPCQNENESANVSQIDQGGRESFLFCISPNETDTPPMKKKKRKKKEKERKKERKKKIMREKKDRKIDRQRERKKKKKERK